MTTPTPADAVREAVQGLSTLEVSPEEIAADAIRVAADTLLPRRATGDRSQQADRDRLLCLQFLALANELAGNPPPAASREALAEAREESQAAAWQGIEPEQVLPAVEKLAQFVAADIPPGPYSEHDLREQWNRGAADGDDWDSLESCEQLAWAQAIAIAADRGRTAQAAETTPARLRHCPTHGQQGPEAWGCPECLRELRTELATAREALRRLVVWGGFSPFLHKSTGLDHETVFAVADWFAGGMTGPLPPLPPLIASWEGADPTPSAPALPPAIAYECGDGVRISATNPETNRWVAWREIAPDRECLCLDGRWSIEPRWSFEPDFAAFETRSRWPSAEAAWAALLEYRAGKGVEG